jgi:hypothetical protein
MPITQPKSSSMKAFTYSTMAFDAGKSCVNSLRPSAAQIAITPNQNPESIYDYANLLAKRGLLPIITRARSAPPGPAISIAEPPLLKIPEPITELRTMNYNKHEVLAKTQEAKWRLLGLV